LSRGAAAGVREGREGLVDLVAQEQERRALARRCREAKVDKEKLRGQGDSAKAR